MLQAGALGTMVTNCVQRTLLPWTSVTVQMTLVVPTKYTAGALLVTFATAQLSLVLDGTPRATFVMVQPPRSALVVTSAGQVIVGNSVSVIVTTCEQVLLWPLVSMTVQCTVVLPTVMPGQLSPVSGEPSKTPVA